MSNTSVVLLLTLCLLWQQTEATGRLIRTRKLEEGDGINFPRRPLSKTEAEQFIFNRNLYAIYRISNPKFEDSVARDLKIFYDLQSNGDVIENWDARFDGVCLNDSWLYRSVEANGAVYTFDGPFPVTGEGISVSFFTHNPQDYVFAFFCLDKTKEIVRYGRRVYCDGPWTVVFLTYEYPPNRVKWCDASKDLWAAYGLSFDNDFIRYEPTGVPCPEV